MRLPGGHQLYTADVRMSDQMTIEMTYPTVHLIEVNLSILVLGRTLEQLYGKIRAIITAYIMYDTCILQYIQLFNMVNSH